MERALTADRIAELEADIFARPVRPGNFRCAGCRHQFPQQDRHTLFSVCDSCGNNEIEDLLVEMRGPDTLDNRRAALAALAILTEAMIEKRRPKPRRRKAV